jgi:opacity protein-like surface antigen
MLKSKAIAKLSALALASAMTILAPAQAAVVVASFDPAFGPSIPNLGFRGTAQISVADSCFSLSGLVFNSDGCSGNTMSVLSADVEFYNVNTPLVTLGSATWAGSYFNVLAVFMQDGDLTGVDTDISLPSTVTLFDGAGPTDVNFSGLISVQFYTGALTTAAGPEVLAGGTSDATVAGRGGVRLYNCVGGTANGCGASAEASNSATVTYTGVPEPTTPALVVLALAAAAVTRRRALQARAS